MRFVVTILTIALATAPAWSAPADKPATHRRHPAAGAKKSPRKPATAPTGRPGMFGGPGGEGAMAAAGAKGGQRSPIRRGNSLLHQGYYRMAVLAFEEAVAANPLLPEAHLGLGVARARLGTCAPALEEFRAWSDSIAFGAKVALLAAHCAERQDYREEAVAFSLAAWAKRPDNRTTLARLALDADLMGDTVLSNVAIEYLWYVNPEQDESLFAEAALALRHGDLTAFDAFDAMWRREGRSSEEMNRMRARSWLDAGDPVAAYDELRKGGSKLKRGAESRVLMAETTRRLGQLSDASRALDGVLQGKLSGADSDAVQARILVDLGDLDGAAALMASYTNELDEDVIASRWYLARARGDQTAQVVEAAAFEESRKSPLRTLDQYIPITDVR